MLGPIEWVLVVVLVLTAVWNLPKMLWATGRRVSPRVPEGVMELSPMARTGVAMRSPLSFFALHIALALGLCAYWAALLLGWLDCSRPVHRGVNLVVSGVFAVHIVPQLGHLSTTAPRWAGYIYNSLMLGVLVGGAVGLAWTGHRRYVLVMAATFAANTVFEVIGVIKSKVAPSPPIP